MKILPLDPRENASPEALHAFLQQCQAVAAQNAHPQLVSITLEVDALDPLAVLESIFEPTERHFYVERPQEGLAVAGAEAVLVFTTSGHDRFEHCQRFIDEALDNTLAVGDLSAPFSGPHFFHAYSFFDDTEPGEPFEAASVFVPRWQVAVWKNRTVAVANVLVDERTPLDAVAARIWRARQKFIAFDYEEPDFSEVKSVGASSVREVGEVGAYQKAVERAVKMIGQGEFQKIVLARAKDLQAASVFHPLRVLNDLRQKFSDCYAFSVANGRGQSLIGASPERLLQVRDDLLVTEALAGSARRGKSASEDAALGGALLRSEKDLAEHEYVVQAIERRLAPLGLKLEFSNKPGLKRLPNVQHLHTPIRAALAPNVKLLDALARLHPTPAVGGTPREKAVSRIRELEGFPRGLYAGAVGWSDCRGEGEFFVGLRSALIDGDRARAYAGAGIVAGSEPGKEFAETELKFRALIEALVG
ncbi:MAG TPA: isochorismate synthase [Opitutaceae bacterium]|nr:isochorismate synthase [Opitutaceae bacterium]